MSRLSDYLEGQYRAHLFRTASFAKPSGLFVSLHTADPTDTGAGAEVTGGSYARVSRAPLDANWTAASSTDGITTNAAALTFPAPTANWGVVTHFAIWDASTSGNMLVYGQLGTPKTINSGDAAPSFAIGAVSVNYDPANSKFSDYLEGQLRGFTFRTQATFPKPSGLFVSLHTADPTDTGAGAEVSGGSYARVSRAPLDANWTAASSTDGVTTNAAALTFPAPTANWGVCTHFGIWDASTSGNLLVYGALGTPKTINNGDAAPAFATGALSLTFQ